jgi:ketosteroid isomerase-like protein
MRRRFQSAILIACSTFLIISCSNEKGATTIDLDAVKKDIQAMEDAYAAAEKEKDAVKIAAAYYSDDAISYSRNRMPEVGKSAIKESLAKRLAADTSGNTNVYKVVDLFGEGNMLVEIGSWTEMSPAGAEVNKGHYMSYFQKRDGKYVCVRDMNVTSSPAK